MVRVVDQDDTRPSSALIIVTSLAQRLCFARANTQAQQSAAVRTVNARDASNLELSIMCGALAPRTCRAWRGERAFSFCFTISFLYRSNSRYVVFRGLLDVFAHEGK